MKKSLLLLASAVIFSAPAFASGVSRSADQDVTEETPALGSVQDYTVTPTVNTKGTVSSISPIVLTFTNAATVTNNPTADYYSQYTLVEYNSPRAGWGDIPAEVTIAGNALSITLETNDQIDGEFRVTIPAGTYLLDGKENEDIEVSLTYANPLVYTTTPMANSYTKNIAEPIVVTFTNAEEVTDNPNADMWTQYAILEYNSPKMGWGDIPVEPTVEGNAISFKLEEQDQIDGEYRLTIPAGTYLVDGLENTEIILNFKAVSAQEYLVTPEANANGIVNTISPIVLTFPYADTIEDNPNADYWTQYALVEYNSPRVGWNDIPTEATIAGTSISFPLEAGDQVEGEYRVIIPAGTYLIDGEENKYIEVLLTYGKLLTYTTTPATTATTTQVDQIAVTFPNAVAVEANPDADYYSQFAFIEYNSPRAGWGDIPAEVSVEDNAINFALDEQDKINGEFQVTIPAGTYLVDGQENPEIVFSFNYLHSIDVAVSSVGYATFCSEYATKIPAGVEAYVGALSDDNTTLNLTAISGVIPACTAVILKAEEGNYGFETTTETVEAIEGNVLKGTYSAQSTKDVEGQVYILSHTDGKQVGFYKFAGETLAANKAYLVLPVNSAAPVVRFNFGEGTDNVSGIESIEVKNADAARIFDLQGRSLLQAPQKGMYILNGRKVIR